MLILGLAAVLIGALLVPAARIFAATRGSVEAADGMAMPCHGKSEHCPKPCADPLLCAQCLQPIIQQSVSAAIERPRLGVEMPWALTALLDGRSVSPLLRPPIV